MKTLEVYKLGVWLVASLLSIITLGFSLYSNVVLDDKMAILSELDKIVESIARANQAIRMSAMAPTVKIREDQLAVRMETRKVVDGALKKIDTYKLNKNEYAVYTAMKFYREDPYRYSQNQVVNLIRNDIPLEDLWGAMSIYQEHQKVYIELVNELNKLIIQDVRIRYKILLWYIVFVIITSIVGAEIYMSIHIKEIKNSRYCPTKDYFY